MHRVTPIGEKGGLEGVKESIMYYSASLSAETLYSGSSTGLEFKVN
jgi:hypothetical protein